MAPRMLRDYHCVGDLTRYSLRTIKHGKSNFPKSHNVDTSKINGKEDFLRCVGLQMRRSQHNYKTFNGNRRTKAVNIPNNVMLRDCSVVILGATCKICGKCFKCETDVNVHMKVKHRTCSEEKDITAVAKKTQCTIYDNEVCQLFSKPFQHAIVAADKSSEIKLNRKLRLTLKIGKEVVAKISVKRKHLKANTTNISAQTELYNATGLIVHKDGCKSVASRIDPPVFNDSPCQCCNSVIHVVNSMNRYLVSNVASKEIAHEQSKAIEGNPLSSRLKESCAMPSCEKCDPVRNIITPGTEKCDASERNNTKNVFCHKNCNSNEFVSTGLNNSILDKVSYNCENCKERTFRTSIVGFNEKNDSIKSIVNDTDASLNHIVRYPSKNIENDKQKDVNANEKSKDTSLKKQSQNTTNTIPAISEVIVSSKDIPCQLLNSVESSVPSQQHSASPQQQSISSQQQSIPSQQQSASSQQQITTEGNPDDEIQEVLRIVRGYNSNDEINHESPNRSEQEMLLWEAIRDMRKMEKEGWHLLEKDLVNRKRRVSPKSDPKSVAAKEFAKNKRKAAVQSNSEHNVKGPTANKCVSTMKEHNAKVQSHKRLCVSDNSKENLLICNGNIDIPREVLRHYGINYYNEVFEINNNTENIQEPAGHFPVPCSGRMESWSNRPTVIDLVNDADESAIETMRPVGW